MQNPLLTAVEARVVAVLIEKQRTVPDTYPLSLAALTAGCNQKSARDPVMVLSENDVLAAIETLRSGSWVIESSGSRVMRYEQNALRVLQVPSNGLALLAVLMLRGPQTAAELRANADRYHHFADTSSVEAYLDELASRPAGALVVRLARAPGARESRWAHLLCGVPAGSEHAWQADGRRDDDRGPLDRGSAAGSSARPEVFAGASGDAAASRESDSAGSTTHRHDAAGDARFAALEERIAMIEYEATERLAALESQVATLSAQFEALKVKDG